LQQENIICGFVDRVSTSGSQHHACLPSEVKNCQHKLLKW